MISGPDEDGDHLQAEEIDGDRSQILRLRWRSSLWAREIGTRAAARSGWKRIAAGRWRRLGEQQSGPQCPSWQKEKGAIDALSGLKEGDRGSVQLQVETAKRSYDASTGAAQLEYGTLADLNKKPRPRRRPSTPRKPA